MDAVLLLNADHTPLKVLDYRKAIWLLLEEKVWMLEQYAGKTIRSSSLELPWPAVIVLKKHVRVSARVKFKRPNVLARDHYTCQYCGAAPKHPSGTPDTRRLTMDHVVPRSRAVQGRVVLPWNGKTVSATTWENIVTACEPCNGEKADRTPEEAGMALACYPRRPNPFDVLRIVLLKMSIPEEWAEHVQR